MNSIQKHSKIDAAKLSTEFYFQSLLQEAYMLGELNAVESERVQMECIKLLAESTERYTKGNSSSVQIETAQEIMTSNLYTIGIYLKSLPGVEVALNEVINVPIEELYDLGYQVINRKLKVARYFFQLVRKTKIATQHQAYNETIEGIKLFFMQYNPQFSAHEMPGDIDYQLMHPVISLAGVEYIIQYLENLYYENLFCSKFDAQAVSEVMWGYDEGYEDLLENIFEHILQSALGCGLIGKNRQSLDFSPADLQIIKSTLVGKNQQSVLAALLPVSIAMLDDLGLKNTSLRHYVHLSLPDIAVTIFTAYETNSLNNVFSPRYNPNTKPMMTFYMGVKMDDAAYREVMEEFLSCRYFEDKLEIIKEHIKTLSDLEDIIIGGELTDTEAAMVFDLLGDVEIGALAKRHTFNQEVNAVDFSEAEIRMQYNLQKYLQRMPKNRLGGIYEKMKSIEVI
ncbi:DUF6179 domain-containing protein [Acetobacterium bakii]|uniref:Uncharacterized protein n=1 Tax=Acetobacterium bakii TaxID=52689 RepID=A0A0L6U2R5_9FIRM|nr:DUF6179 domain-containing protein [Acetobacterium bakii]KNZ42080.1 hypothetical protein AKG39_08600 [Acetobacterium bakii]